LKKKWNPKLEPRKLSHYDNIRATSIHVCGIINFENSMFKKKMLLNIPTKNFPNKKFL